MELPQEILKLDEDVVNKIAAGEVIQRPSNALKELLENALDAKSTNISVVADKGGMESLVITDNGTGIRKEDLNVVAERFTTSKLSTFEDLNSICTYGFRGEALASISHVARLSIVTKTSNSSVGYKASYLDGKLIGPPKASAANQGTQIIVENLFYNLPTRSKALKNNSDEFNRLADVISKYAIHNSKVGFTLKKKSEASVIVRTMADSTPSDNISTVYGSTVAKELIPFEVEDPVYQFKAKGLVSNVNYNSKKMIFLLFINHRLVESSSLKKALDTVYGSYLPKGTHPFVYLSLEIEPSNVDVNVHPTKHEVHFLHQDEIVEKIQSVLNTKLLSNNSSRTFYAQTLLPGAAPVDVSTVSEAPKKMYEKNYVRTDYRDQKMDSFVTKTQSQSSNNQTLIQSETSNTKIPFKSPLKERSGSIIIETYKPLPKNSNEFSENDSQTSSSKIPPSEKKERRKIQLTSLKTLNQEISDESSPGLRETVAHHTFVGLIDREKALIQFGTKLLISNTSRLSSYLFYQLLIKDFGNFDCIRLQPSPSIKDLALKALDDPDVGWNPEHGSKEEIAEYIKDFLISKADMLDDYFSIEIDEEGHLITLPSLLDDYVPYFGKLPVYLVKLATDVNWDNETECFRTFCLETAKFYSVINIEGSQYDCKQHEVDNDSDAWKEVLEHILYPAIKKNCHPPKSMAKDSTFTQIADLPELYKVFERC